MKRTLFIGIALVAGFFALQGCTDDQAEINQDFQVDSDQAEYDSATNTLNFKGARNTAQISVVTDDATGKWDARCPTDDLWCSFSKEGNKLVVTVDNNATDKLRTSHITIVLGGTERTVKVAQDYIRNLTFVTNDLTVGAGSGNYAIGIKTNILPENLHFEIQDAAGTPITDPDFWLKSGLYADGQVAFTVAKNKSETEIRTAMLVAQGDEMKATFVVSQNMASGKPYSVSLAALNYEFDEGAIYEIWDNVNNIKIGNICREYLLKATTASEVVVRTVGVVAYPVKKGVVDHANGFVIATLDETSRPVADGGSIMWNGMITAQTKGSEMIATYTKGTATEVPATIYMALGGSGFSATPLDAEDAPDAVIAEIKPWTVTDKREGAEITDRGTFDEFTYSVVKVGCQYWFAQNLKTTRFKDGTPIPTDNWNEASLIAGPQCASAGYAIDGTSYNNGNANAMSDAAIAVRNETGPVYNFFSLFNSTMADVTNAYAGSVVDALSPDGWGVPTQDEFTILNNYITQCADNPASDPKYELTLKTKMEPKGTNITGFGAEGYRYRSATGGVSSKGTHYATSDSYSFTGTAGAGKVSDHNTVAFCCGEKTESSFRAVDITYGIYVRCIKRDAPAQ
ncbi:MAG: FISUMP domain-containing protein [Alistipes sp.]